MVFSLTKNQSMIIEDHEDSEKEEEEELKLWPDVKSYEDISYVEEVKPAEGQEEGTVLRFKKRKEKLYNEFSRRNIKEK